MRRMLLVEFGFRGSQVLKAPFEPVVAVLDGSLTRPVHHELHLKVIRHQHEDLRVEPVGDLGVVIDEHVDAELVSPADLSVEDGRPLWVVWRQKFKGVVADASVGEVADRAFRPRRRLRMVS